MAGMRLLATHGKIAFSTSTLTVLQVTAPTNQRLKLKGWGISFDGVSNTGAPIQVQLFRGTSAGTFTSLTPVKKDKSQAETIQSTAGYLATGEPSVGDILEEQLVHPQAGYANYFPFGNDIDVPGAGQIDIRLVSPGAGANCSPFLDYEE